MIQRTVRKGAVSDQDEVRRADMRRMGPGQRMAALLKMRDMAFPYQPLKRVAALRKLT